MITAVKSFTVQTAGQLSFVPSHSNSIFNGEKKCFQNRNYSLASYLGNCDICAEQKILFMNEMKRYEIWPRLKGWVQKIFQTFLPNLTKVALNFVNFAQFKWKWVKWSEYLTKYSSQFSQIYQIFKVFYRIQWKYIIWHEI